MYKLDLLPNARVKRSIDYIKINKYFIYLNSLLSVDYPESVYYEK